jgi:hypothetical protein
MKDLEKYVKENLDQFNDAEPDPDHFEKFRNKLEMQDRGDSEIHRSGMMLKIAAVILIFLTVAVFIFDHSIRGLRNMLIPQTANVIFPRDVSDAMQYYSQQASQGVHEINQLAPSGKEAQALKDMTLNDLRALDANTTELTKAYQENPNDERITSAIIRNQQMKETIIKNVIQQMVTSHQSSVTSHQ